MIFREIKRKVFHTSPWFTMILLRAVLPRWLSVWFFVLILLIVGGVGVYPPAPGPKSTIGSSKNSEASIVPAEIMGASGIFWTLLGCWANDAGFYYQ